MTLFVHITENCYADAQEHSLTEDVERFKERVEQTQSRSLFDPFPPPYVVKKKLGGRQGRLIAESRPVGEHAVVVFLAIIIKGSRGSRSPRTRSPTAAPTTPVLPPMRNWRNSWLNGPRNRLCRQNRQCPKPYALLYDAFGHHQRHGLSDDSRERHADDLVCETPEWVAQVGREPFSKHLNRVYSACLEAVYQSPGLLRLPVKERPRLDR